MLVTHAEAGLFGRVDSVGAADNRSGHHRNYLEEQVDITYVDEQAGWRLATALSARLEGRAAGRDEWIFQGDIYHLYAEQTLNGGTLSGVKMGRMQRADALGFYTLDGAEVRGEWSPLGAQAFTLYAGRPGRIDDYYMVEADLLLGGELQWDSRPLNYRYEGLEISSINGRVELQHLRRGDSESRINWSINAVGRLHQSRLSDLSLGFGGSYQIKQRRLEELLFSVVARRGREEYLKLEYQSYSPASPTLTFREQYYSLYVPGQQQEFAASYRLRPKNRISWGVKGRLVTREKGGSGLGFTGSLGRWQYSKSAMSAQLDLLKLGGDSASTLYLEGERPLGALTRLRAALVLQHQQKQLAGDNSAIGIDGEWEKMLSSTLYLSVALTHIWNSRLNDEYRLGIRLSYRFDDRKGWQSE